METANSQLQCQGPPQLSHCAGSNAEVFQGTGQCAQGKERMGQIFHGRGISGELDLTAMPLKLSIFPCGGVSPAEGSDVTP